MQTSEPIEQADEPRHWLTLDNAHYLWVLLFKPDLIRDPRVKKVYLNNKPRRDQIFRSSMQC